MERGQIEVPATSLAEIHQLPQTVITDISSQLDYSYRLWRQRVVGTPNADQWDRSTAAVDARIKTTLLSLQRRMDALSEAAKRVLVSAQSCKGLADAVHASDARRIGGRDAYERDSAACDEINRVACSVADVFVGCGPPFSGEHPDDKKRLPTSTFQTHMFVLWILMDLSRKRMSLDPSVLRKVILDQTAPTQHRFSAFTSDGSEVHDGVILFHTLYARLIRIEASLLRRYFESGMYYKHGTEDRGADVLLPGWMMYWRSCVQGQVPFSFDPKAEGGFGDEIVFDWKFDAAKTKLFQYVCTRRNEISSTKAASREE